MTNLPARYEHVETELEEMRGELVRLLPKYLGPDRFLRIALTTLSDSPELLECSPASIAIALLDCAQLGLEPGGVRQQAYLVKFGKTAVLIPGYRGLIFLARQSGLVKDVVADVVHEADDFDFEKGSTPFLRHKATLVDRGEILAFWALAYPADGSNPTVFEVMSKADVDVIQKRALARSKGAGPWITDYSQMGRKTAIKRLWKLLPDDPRLAAAIALDDASEAGQEVHVADVLEPTPKPPEQPTTKIATLAARLTPELPAEAENGNGPPAQGEEPPPIEDEDEPAPAPKAQDPGTAYAKTTHLKRQILELCEAQSWNPQEKVAAYCYSIFGESPELLDSSGQGVDRRKLRTEDWEKVLGAMQDDASQEDLGL